jgi:polysaccharide biosynthesis/export protein
VKLASCFLTLMSVLSVFAQDTPKAHASVMAGSARQKLSAHDLVTVEVYSFPELSLNLRVSADGTIQLPLLSDRVKIGGLLTEEAAALVAERIKQSGLVEHPRVTLSILELGSAPIRVLGAVKTPTTFQAGPQTSMTDAIIQAGGFLPEAGSEIVVTRPAPADGSNPEKLQISRLRLLAGELGSDITLQGGEEIRVPYAGRVYVLGDVRTPGAYPMDDGKNSTVLQTLAQAGGLNALARSNAYVIRQDSASGKREQVPVPLKRILNRDSSDVALLPGDILYIPDNHGRHDVTAVLERVLQFGTSISTRALIP